MIGILDTQAFLWMDSDPAKLSLPAATFIKDLSNTLLLSAVSVWEILIKQQSGKLNLQAPLTKILADQQMNGVQILPIRLDHVLGIETLPLLHKDPFDRLLIAQTMIENGALISYDRTIRQYSVNVVW